MRGNEKELKVNPFDIYGFVNYMIALFSILFFGKRK